ncbi:hypothetical protein GCM10010104_21940 [Streptomyces indiaensis]|uniref:Uncharacterized protein n=1 Tax=Streptomyces indiaensis TaxID=284033 RepID=A0ABN3DE80_9ACTN
MSTRLHVGGPVQGQTPADALGEAQRLAQGRLRLLQPAPPAVADPHVGVGQGEVAATPAGRLVGAQCFVVEGFGAVEAVGEAVRVGQHQQQLYAPLGVGPAEPRGEPAVDEGAVAQFHDLLGVLTVHQGVEAAQDEQGAFGVVPAGAGAREVGEPLGAAG